MATIVDLVACVIEARKRAEEARRLAIDAFTNNAANAKTLADDADRAQALLDEAKARARLGGAALFV